MPDHRPVAVAERDARADRRGPRTGAAALRPTITSRTPRAKRRPSTMRSSSRMAKAAGCTPRNGTLLGSVSPLRGRSTITTSSAEASGRPAASRAMPGRLPSSDRLVARHAARQLGVGAGAQHDHAVGPAGAGQRVAEALGHGEHGDEHADHARDADDDDQRGAEPLRDVPQVDQRDLDDLVQRRPASAVPRQRVDDPQPAHAQRRRQPDRRAPARARCARGHQPGARRPRTAAGSGRRWRR